MWNGADTVRALRGERAAIVSGWRTEAQQELWHLDPTLLSRRGVVTRCGVETLETLIAWHQARQTASLNGATAVHAAGTDPVHQEPSRDAGDRTEAENCLQLSPVLQCVPRWEEQGLPWSDLRRLLALLQKHLAARLVSRGLDRDTIALNHAALDTLAAELAHRQVASLEKQLVAHRDETMQTLLMTDRFAGNASHELRTPLTAVIGLAELLLEDFYGTLNVRQTTAIKHIENQAHNLLEVVNNFLDLLQIRTGKLNPQYRPVAVAGILNGLHEMLRPLADRKQVALLLEVEEGIGEIEADTNILRHVLYLLVSSALRATPAGGQVWISARRDASRVLFSVKDTALHLPKSALENMLNPFSRLENSPVRGYEAWEVGLPLARRYIDAHGGTFEVESLPDRGTTFHIGVPLSR